MYVSVNSYVKRKTYDKNGNLISNFYSIGIIFVRNESVIIASSIDDLLNEKYLCTLSNGNSFYTDQTGADNLGINTR